MRCPSSTVSNRPGTCPALLDRSHRGVERNVEGTRGGERAEHVRDVEAAAQRRAQLGDAIGRMQREARAREVGAQIVGAVGGAGVIEREA